MSEFYSDEKQQMPVNLLNQPDQLPSALAISFNKQAYFPGLTVFSENTVTDLRVFPGKQKQVVYFAKQLCRNCKTARFFPFSL